MRTVRAYWLGLILITRISIAFAQQQQPVTPIPVLTDEDRAAAFPDVGTHRRKNALNHYVLFDRLEWRAGNGERTANWDTVGWFGGDIHRLWFRTEGEADRHAVRDAEAQLLYGRSFSRWWDFVAGVRQDFRPSLVQTWGAVGIQGLAPNFFEIQATAYVNPSGRIQGRLEAEYEMLITNRLILQPRTEFNVSGKSDKRRNVGSGLTTAEAGLFLRYEFRREFAPYFGLEWNQKFGRTAEFSRSLGEPTRGTRFVTGVRVWF